MIVADASVAVAAVLRDGAARTALEQDWVHAPHLVDSEVAHVLRRQAAAGLVRPDRAWSALDTWRRLGVIRHPGFPLFDRVWELRENLTAHDATYVALAEHLGCSPVTGDGRMSRAPGVRCPITVVPG